MSEEERESSSSNNGNIIEHSGSSLWITGCYSSQLCSTLIVRAVMNCWRLR